MLNNRWPDVIRHARVARTIAARKALLGVAFVVLVAVACSSGGGGQQTTPSASPDVPTPTPYAPIITPSNFSDQITNPYFPLTPGTTYAFEGKRENIPQRVEVNVTHDTRTIMGVRCVVVHDVVTLRGELHEDTYDWYAQDSAGNVWYFGEDSKEYANGQVISTKGSWEAGVAGAQPGIIMEASPKVGGTYRQEFYEGEAEDRAQVIKVGDSKKVTSGSYQEVVVTEDSTPLDPGHVEHKYFAPGVGFIFGIVVKGGSEQLELVSITTP